jgi:hypothetical protein
MPGSRHLLSLGDFNFLSGIFPTGLWSKRRKDGLHHIVFDVFCSIPIFHPAEVIDRKR